MKRLDMESIQAERPNLYLELQWRNVSDVFQMNNIPTGPDAEKAGKKTWLLLAKGKDYDYIIQSMAGANGKPDKFLTWIHYDRQEQERPKAGYIIIDKAKVGRPRRQLSDAERQEIQARHEAGESINAIAKALHLGTRRVMEALKGGA